MAGKFFAGVAVEVDSEGFMTRPEQWTKEIAAEIAKEEGIAALTAGHWKVIEFMRQDVKEKGTAPTIRRLNKVAGIDITELYALFPNGPAKKAARIAGLGKPQGCV